MKTQSFYYACSFAYLCQHFLQFLWKKDLTHLFTARSQVEQCCYTYLNNVSNGAIAGCISKQGCKEILKDDNSSPPVARKMQLHCLQGFTPSPAWKRSSWSSALGEVDFGFMTTCVVPVPSAKMASFWFTGSWWQKYTKAIHWNWFSFLVLCR